MAAARVKTALRASYGPTTRESGHTGHCKKDAQNPENYSPENSVISIAGDFRRRKGEVMPDKKLTLAEQAQEILRIAEQHGVEQNFFFLTTFSRYNDLIKKAGQLKAAYEQEDLLVTKEYVKGRKNIYVHPAAAAHDRACQAANQTAQTLMKIISDMRDDGDGAGDELLEFLRGGKKRGKRG